MKKNNDVFTFVDDMMLSIKSLGDPKESYPIQKTSRLEEKDIKPFPVSYTCNEQTEKILRNKSHLWSH